MEENLEQNIEANKEIPDKTNTSDSEEIKNTNSEKRVFTYQRLIGLESF